MRLALPPPLLLLLCALAGRSACQHVTGLGPSVTGAPLAGNHSSPGHEMSLGVEYEDADYKEEDDAPLPLYMVDESIRVEPVVKPKQTKENEKKDSGKPKRGRNKKKKNKKKKGTPCETEYKNFCIHGVCIYLEDLYIVTCKCHPDYFGERCGEQSMKIQTRNNTSDYPKTILVVAAVVLSSISFIAIVIYLIMQVKKKCPQYEEKEERKKLRKENRNGHVGV
ncbi:amphiregulin isoform X1 [Alligator mississippiensis]|uniref:amphiregulin isoform X1 n=1 Tax=Alligator mississippiensis TaxID=8496 RepID=UPI0003D09670|nr:amphiregulin isoform X1 [Alligator mississippiensis]